MDFDSNVGEEEEGSIILVPSFPRKVNAKGDTWLHDAIRRGNTYFPALQGPNKSKHPLSLLLEVNYDGDTPLHVAARRGHFVAVKLLIGIASRHKDVDLESGIGIAHHMLRMTNDKRNTALHEAVMHEHLYVVKLITLAGPDVPSEANRSGQTPVTIALANESLQILSALLVSLSYEGPSGMTALHTVVKLNCRYVQEARVIARTLLERETSLARKTDHHGWTPLHFAAAFVDHNDAFIPKMLLQCDAGAALIADIDETMTALHLAAGQGNIWLVEEIINVCPESCQLVDRRGWNVLHFAMVSLTAGPLRRLLRNQSVMNLINKKDQKGNTPLHVLATLCRESSYEIVRKNGYGDYQAVNDKNFSVEHALRFGFPELEEEIQELTVCRGQYEKGIVRMKKDKVSVRYLYWKFIDQNVIGVKEASQQHLVVAALIATVTFAAAFTVPGGYKSDEGPNQGTAVLSKNAAFQAFVISDAIAMVLSLSAVFVHFILSLRAFQEFVFLFVFALAFTVIAMVAMVIAFVSGIYAVLSPSLGLAIATCIIGMNFFLLVSFMIYKVRSKRKESED